MFSFVDTEEVELVALLISCHSHNSWARETNTECASSLFLLNLLLDSVGWGILDVRQERLQRRIEDQITIINIDIDKNLNKKQ